MPHVVSKEGKTTHCSACGRFTGMDNFRPYHGPELRFNQEDCPEDLAGKRVTHVADITCSEHGVLVDAAITGWGAE